MSIPYPAPVYPNGSAVVEAAYPIYTQSTPEILEQFIVSSTSAIEMFLKGILMGIIAGLFVASVFLCWLPCIHFFYANPGEDLHHLHFDLPDIHFRRLRPFGGFRAWIRRRIRMFLMGRERNNAVRGAGGSEEATHNDAANRGVQHDQHQGQQVQQQHEVVIQPPVTQAYGHHLAQMENSPQDEVVQAESSCDRERAEHHRNVANAYPFGV